MRKHLCLILMLCLFCFTFTEAVSAAELYLISGTPNEAVSMPEYPIDLFKVDEKAKAVAKVRRIAEENISYIHPYYDERFVYALSRTNKGGYFSSEYKIIDMNMPSIEKSIMVDIKGISQASEGMLLNLPELGIYVASYGIKYEKGYNPSDEYSVRSAYISMTILGANTITEKQKVFTYKDLQHVVLYGTPSGMRRGGGRGFGADQNTENYITILAPKGARLRTKWKLPKNIKKKATDDILISVNNKDMLVAIGTKLRNNEKGLGSSQYYILDKESGEWHLLALQGGITNVRTFGGPWLAGAISGMYRGNPSPGHSKRKKKARTTGLYYDWKMTEWRVYDTGELYLYNIKTRKKYKIKTGDGDSEVLFVDGNSVYYRMSDEIYKAEIGKNKVGEGKLLAKDEIILDVHWAFMGPDK